MEDQIMTSWACLRLLHDLSKGSLTYANIAYLVGFADRSEDWRICKPARIRNSNWWQDDPGSCWKRYHDLYISVLRECYGEDKHAALLAIRDALEDEHALIAEIRLLVDEAGLEPTPEVFEQILRVMKREARPGREYLYRVRSEHAPQVTAAQTQPAPAAAPSAYGLERLRATLLDHYSPRELFPFDDGSAFARELLPEEVTGLLERHNALPGALAGPLPTPQVRALSELLRNDSGLALGKLESRCRAIADLVGPDETFGAAYEALDELKVSAESEVRSTFRTFVDGDAGRALAFAALATLAGPAVAASLVKRHR